LHIAEAELILKMIASPRHYSFHSRHLLDRPSLVGRRGHKKRVHEVLYRPCNPRIDTLDLTPNPALRIQDLLPVGL
jgi:hypothetical protein